MASLSFWSDRLQNLPKDYFELPFEPGCNEELLLRYGLAQPGAAFLDSCHFKGKNTLRWGPELRFQCYQDQSIIESAGQLEESEAGPLELLTTFTDRISFYPDTTRVGNWADLGWVIFASYELYSTLEPTLKLQHNRPSNFPLLQGSFHSWSLVKEAGRWWLRGLSQDLARFKRFREKLYQKLKQFKHVAESPDASLQKLQAAWGFDDYKEAFSELQRNIQSGEIYQANLSQRFHARGKISTPELYLKLRQASPAPYAAFLDCGRGRYLLSSSPESFYSVEDGLIQTAPIKGTRPVALDKDQDRALQQELFHSEKDRAELTMIVDLERNDLGRICKPGTIKVPELFKVKSYRHVHHLVALVQGKLQEQTTFSDLLRAGFPGGSITGAPKLRAIEVLQGLEPYQRGPYTGSIFALGQDGSLRSNILIRTLGVEPDLLSFHTGGGIVADSELHFEYEECFHKAQGMIQALESFCDISCCQLGS